MPTRPDFCPFIYHDGQDLFLEFSGLVLRFPFTEGGLAKALAHIPNVAAQPGFSRTAQMVLDKMHTQIARRSADRLRISREQEPARSARQSAAVAEFLKSSVEVRKLPKVAKRINVKG